LLGAADELTINFPWGSLLRGVLGHDDAVLAGVAALLAPRASGSVLFSLTPRDGMPEPAGDLAAVYARHGLSVRSRPVTDVTVRSSWAKRIRAGSAARPVTHLSVTTSAGAF
jgi:16S rRNA (adenine(1408)-N(1))-methyltransferase